MSRKKNVLVVGASGHAKVVIDILEKGSNFRIVGLSDETLLVGERVLGYEVLCQQKEIPQVVKNKGVYGCVIAIGDNFIRFQVAKRVKKLCPDLVFVHAVHPKSQLGKNVFVGEGTVVMAGVVVNPCCTIGNFCILNTNSSLDHDSKMGDYSSLAPNCATGGNVSVGRFSALGIGSTVAHGVEIGEHSVLGAGALALSQIGSFEIAYGVPAEFVRKRELGEKYL